MNAAQITHTLKVVGFNRSMVTGIAVLMAFAMAFAWVSDNKEQALDGLFS